jgi:translocator protein
MKLQLPSSTDVLLMVASLAVTYAVGYASSWFMDDRSDWYDKMKPVYTPPGIVFTIVWAIMFFLLSISLFLTLRLKNVDGPRAVAIALYAINLVLIFLWTPTFFKWRQFAVALAEIVGMLLISFILIYVHFKRTNSPIAAMTLVPYAMWLVFAFVLNLHFVTAKQSGA